MAPIGSEFLVYKKRYEKDDEYDYCGKYIIINGSDGQPVFRYCPKFVGDDSDWNENLLDDEDVVFLLFFEFGSNNVFQGSIDVGKCAIMGGKKGTNKKRNYSGKRHGRNKTKKRHNKTKKFIKRRN